MRTPFENIKGDKTGVVLIQGHGESETIDQSFNTVIPVAPHVQAQTFAVGDEVLYSPVHMSFEPSHQNQFGVVSSVSGEYPTQKVWVRYSGETGQLTPTKCLVKKNTVFYQIEGPTDHLHRCRFFLHWPADNLGAGINLCGLRAQVFFEVLEDHLERARNDGNICVDWRDKWFTQTVEL